MATPSTQPTGASVDDFLASAEPERRRIEGQNLAALMAEVTGDTPVMWGPTIVGFGAHAYSYPSGHSGTTAKVGFSPRKAQLSLYGLKDHPDAGALLERLGPHTTGAGCIYAKRLDAVDGEVLRELVALAYHHPDHQA